MLLGTAEVSSLTLLNRRRRGGRRLIERRDSAGGVLPVWSGDAIDGDVVVRHHRGWFTSSDHTLDGILTGVEMINIGLLSHFGLQVCILSMLVFIGSTLELGQKAFRSIPGERHR